jgi:8-oxo-dGTP pyrophosphatase MutT (NUDIX family)
LKLVFVIAVSNGLFRPMSLINENHNPWKTLTTEVKYDNPWIQIQHSDVINPAGNPGIYGVVHFKNLAIGIIPLDENNNTWIVGQFRYAINEYSWEIPEGGGKHGVDPIESAKRELLEECGIIANNWERLIDMSLSNSATDERAIIYVARDLTFTESEPEDTEELGLKKIHFDDLFQLVMDGKITDSMSVAAILKLKLRLLGH